MKQKGWLLDYGIQKLGYRCRSWRGLGRTGGRFNKRREEMHIMKRKQEKRNNKMAIILNYSD